MRGSFMFGILAIVGSAVTAQIASELDHGWQPLLGLVEESESTYPLKRCAGLYQSLLDYIGSENMSDKAFDDTDTSLKALITAASVYDRKKGSEGSAADLMKLSMSQARDFAERYVAMYKIQQEQTGHPFKHSEFIMTDFQVCHALANEALEQGFGNWGEAK